jgi:hypothetical protein
MAVVAAAATAFAAGCASSGAPSPSTAGDMIYGGGDGSSCAQAVVIKAAHEGEGVGEEYRWLAARYPGYTRRSQALTRCGAHAADRLSITTADGRDLDVWFDISSFFGKV